MHLYLYLTAISWGLYECIGRMNYSSGILVKISNKVSKPIVHSMAIPVVEFSREGYKIRKCFG